MDAILAEFLARHSVQAEERIAWGNLPLYVSSYITTELPPLQYVTSVRAVVLHGNAILVLHDGTKRLVLPGGRCESGESVHETLSREVLEETGYMIDNAVLLGFMHFHHLAPEPDGYAYPYPNFLQLVFTAEPGEYRPEQMVEDPLVKRSDLMRVDDVVGHDDADLHRSVVYSLHRSLIRVRLGDLHRGGGGGVRCPGGCDGGDSEGAQGEWKDTLRNV